MLVYWLTRRGVKRGTVPNKAIYLHRQYTTWIEKEFGGEVKALAVKQFVAELRELGFEQQTVRAPRGRVVCWMLNKSIVPMSALSV